jgi:hypothetical protein
MPNLTRLRFLLEHIHSFESCSGILAESSALFEEPDGWFFRKLHQAILRLIDEPDMFYGVSERCPSPVLDAISLAALHGIAAIELSDQRELQIASQELGASQNP